jgi:hypothetical protein
MKVHWPALGSAVTARRVIKLSTRWVSGEWPASHPSHSTLWRESPQYPLNWSLSGPQSHSGYLEKRKIWSGVTSHSAVCTSDYMASHPDQIGHQPWVANTLSMTKSRPAATPENLLACTKPLLHLQGSHITTQLCVLCVGMAFRTNVTSLPPYEACWNIMKYSLLNVS